MDSVEKFKRRRDARIKKRMDEEWVTMKGTHVLIDDDGQVKGGPDRVRSLIKEGGGYKKGTKKIIKGAPMFNATNPRAEAEKKRTQGNYGRIKNARKPKIVEKSEEKLQKQKEDFFKVIEDDRYVDNWEQVDAIEAHAKLMPKGTTISHKNITFEKTGDNKWKATLDPKGETPTSLFMRMKSLAESKLEDYDIADWIFGAYMDSDTGGSAKDLFKVNFRGEDAPTMEDDFAAEGYRKNKEGRWEKRREPKWVGVENLEKSEPVYDKYSDFESNIEKVLDDMSVSRGGNYERLIIHPYGKGTAWEFHKNSDGSFLFSDYTGKRKREQTVDKGEAVEWIKHLADEGRRISQNKSGKGTDVSRYLYRPKR